VRLVKSQWCNPRLAASCRCKWLKLCCHCVRAPCRCELRCAPAPCTTLMLSLWVHISEPSRGAAFVPPTAELRVASCDAWGRLCAYVSSTACYAWASDSWLRLLLFRATSAANRFALPASTSSETVLNHRRVVAR